MLLSKYILAGGCTGFDGGGGMVEFVELQSVQQYAHFCMCIYNAAFLTI